MPRCFISLLLAAVTALSLTSASPAAARTAAPPEAGWLFTQTATHGTLAPTRCACRGRFILTLRGAGQLPVSGFTRRWENFGFRADHPNAALTLLDGHKPAHTLVVEIATGALSGFDAARDRRVPRRFNDVSLFIGVTGESGAHDALPHIPATVPPDHGDAGPDGSAG